MAGGSNPVPKFRRVEPLLAPSFVRQPPRKARFAAESLRAGGASDDHGGGHGANAALLEQLWGVCLEQAGELSE